MRSKMTKGFSLLMGVLSVFGSGACVAKRNNKQTKEVVVSVKEDRTPPVVGLLKYFSELEPSFGGVVRSALVLDLATEVVMGGKRLFDYFEVDLEKFRVRNVMEDVIDSKNVGKFNDFLNEVGFHTVYIYADKYSGGQLTRDFAFSVLRKVSDIVISSLSDNKKLEVEINMKDDKAEDKKSESQKILYDALLDLCKVLFSRELAKNANRVIKCFSEACLVTGCIGIDSEGVIYNVRGYPWRWAPTPFRCWGSNGSYNYAEVISAAIVNQGQSDLITIDSKVIK